MRKISEQLHIFNIKLQSNCIIFIIKLWCAFYSPGHPVKKCWAKIVFLSEHSMYWLFFIHFYFAGPYPGTRWSCSKWLHKTEFWEERTWCWKTMLATLQKHNTWKRARTQERDVDTERKAIIAIISCHALRHGTFQKTSTKCLNIAFSLLFTFQASCLLLTLVGMSTSDCCPRRLHYTLEPLRIYLWLLITPLFSKQLTTFCTCKFRTPMNQEDLFAHLSPK
jgi:hypothetical protein